MMVPAIAFAWWFAALPAALPGEPDADPSTDDGLATAEEAAPDPAARVKPRLVNPAMVAAAQSFVTLPMGSERYATVDGKRYVFVLEQHYHPPGYVGGPTGYHKGVTMYELR